MNPRRDSKQLLCRCKNVVYKHSCLLCQSQGKKSSYIGMTCRVLSLRAEEHDAKLEARSMDSHAWRHLSEVHLDHIEADGGLTKHFKWEVINRCSSAFERAVTEVVWIQENSKEETSLNSKDERSCYMVPELTLKEKEETVQTRRWPR